MFTGIVEERGEVLRLERSSDFLRLRIRSDVVASDSAVGSSISVNGCCLTVTDLGDGWWETVAVAETLSRTTMGGLSLGDLVNLERPLLATARIDGHIVQGHVDTTAAVVAVDELEHDARRLVVEMPEAIAAYIVKAAFWTVLLVGLVDAFISFLRVEDLLRPLFGDQLALDLGRNQFRGPYVHGPLLVVSVILPAFVRTHGFTWLALLVVVAEMNIVISRFIFSYEQAFMSDLVRMWYGALFLFASAYTLIEEGHVRVDVLYSGFTAKTKGLVNAVGALVLGLPICWTILIVGLNQPASIIAGPLLTLEVTQSGFGMYIKYLMAAFLAIYAISMGIQFSGYFLEGVADYRRDPGKRQLETARPQ